MAKDALNKYDPTAVHPRIDNVPTAAEFADALTSLGTRVQKQHWRMLIAHYRAPDRTLTPAGLAKAAGYGSFSAANAQYGALGRLLAEYLRYEPPPFRDGSTVWTFVMATEAPSSHWKEWHWKLRPQIAEGLEIVNAV
jgi:hypothetical protein